MASLQFAKASVVCFDAVALSVFYNDFSSGGLEVVFLNDITQIISTPTGIVSSAAYIANVRVVMHLNASKIKANLWFAKMQNTNVGDINVSTDKQNFPLLVFKEMNLMKAPPFKAAPSGSADVEFTVELQGYMEVNSDQLSLLSFI